MTFHTTKPAKSCHGHCRVWVWFAELAQAANQTRKQNPECHGLASLVQATNQTWKSININQISNQSVSNQLIKY